MKIGVLTSSRADFGIYQPLLKELEADDRFALEIIVFGTHLSPYHGLTIKSIVSAGYVKIRKVYGMPLSDEPVAIANAYGLIVSNFSQFWNENNYDLVFALGDRFEMSAAVQAGIPQQVKFAHIHGGETTLGAIDNIYRHQISLASGIHFTAARVFSERVQQLIGHSENVYTVGALSLDGIESLAIPDWEKVANEFGIPEKGRFILVTIHPETIAYVQNFHYSKIVGAILSNLSGEYNIVITMPNADSAGTIYRNEFINLKKANLEKVFIVENFGRLNYFSAMKHSSFMLGNTSSGIIEAASFGKYVINIGDRQQGRAQSKNVVNVSFNIQEALLACEQIKAKRQFTGGNIYHQVNTAQKIINQLINA